MTLEPARSLDPRVFAAILAFTSGCFLVLAFVDGLDDWRAMRSASWPTTTATVLERKTFRVAPTRSTHPPTYYLIHLKYAYVVDGRRYEGDRYNPFGDRVDQATADEALTRFRVGSPCQVAYDPADPGSSYVAPGPRLRAWYVAGTMGGFGSIVLIAAGLVWWRWPRPLTR